VSVSVRLAEPADVAACKTIADQHRRELGFLTRAVFLEAIEKGKLLVARSSETSAIVGFVRINHRRSGTETAIYDVCVDDHYHRQGVGRALVKAVAEQSGQFNRTSIVLLCPEDLSANDFYRSIGFEREGVEAGRRRALVKWRLRLD
jgi:ribosomal protein S18 acetylase RimI-like enzyme